ALGLATERPLAHHVDRPLGQADRPHGVVDAAAAEAGLGDPGGAALTAEKVVGGDAHVLVADVAVAALGRRLAAGADVAEDADAGRVAGTRFGRTDFVKIAEAQGVPGWTATTDPEAERAIVAALAASGPNVVDVHVDPEIVPPTWIEGSGDARSARPSRARVDGST
ncbi:MAG: hypothetical protein GEV09_28705, partial [Pseudonocardiaceae bacterium]|nr:hypothetical protein [Pseudonocardiaceae bacterium]